MGSVMDADGRRNWAAGRGEASANNGMQMRHAVFE